VQPAVGGGGGRGHLEAAGGGDWDSVGAAGAGWPARAGAQRTRDPAKIYSIGARRRAGARGFSADRLPYASPPIEPLFSR
jgi:hypothetical protein